MRDLIINYISGLLVPKLIFEFATATSDYGGAAAITSRLKDFSLDIGMEEGIGVFVLIGILSFKCSAYCVALFFEKKIEKDCLVLKLERVDAICAQIDTYPISKFLKDKLKIHYVLPNY